MNSDPIRLWSGPAPGAHGDKPEDIPTLTPYLPESDMQTGASMLVVPGGGYWHLSEPEGEGYGRWLASKGIAAYVLKYRLGQYGYRHPVMLHDAARGLRIVRSLAKTNGLDPKRVGVIGSSAGGHLAATLLTHHDAGDPKSDDPIEHHSSRPDLGALCYPVISFVDHAHISSRDLLIGKDPPEALARELSAELHVNGETPPCFLWHAVDDDIVPVENSLMFASALRRASVAFALHVYEKGGHGWALGSYDHPVPPWAASYLYFLHEHNFVH